MQNLSSIHRMGAEFRGWTAFGWWRVVRKCRKIVIFEALVVTFVGFVQRWFKSQNDQRLILRFWFPNLKNMRNKVENSTFDRNFGRKKWLFRRKIDFFAGKVGFSAKIWSMCWFSGELICFDDARRITPRRVFHFNLVMSVVSTSPSGGNLVDGSPPAASWVSIEAQIM